jgi:large subunit ribosomal protein L9
MEVILREDIPKLGNKGEIVSVKDGYARNYLLPRRLAILSTVGTRKQVDDMRASAERKAERDKGAAEELAAQLNALELVFTKRSGDQGQLFGSVTSSDVAELVAEKGFTIDRRRLELSEPIKKICEVTVPVRLHRDVTAELRVQVVSDTAEEPAPPPEVAAPVEEPAEEATPAEATPEAEAAATSEGEGGATDEAKEEAKEDAPEAAEEDKANE